MADWTDGPEFAPLVRPDAFVESGAAPLAAPGHAAPTSESPAERPAFDAPDVAPLDRATPRRRDARDPHEAFAVVTSALTPTPEAASPQPATQPLALSSQAPVAGPGTSAWGAAHVRSAQPRPADIWAPQQPFALPDLPPVATPPAPPGTPAPHVNPQSFPPPDARWPGPAYYAPPPGPPAPVPVTTQAVVEASDPWVLACLAGGALVPFAGLSWAAPLLIGVAAVLASRRIRYRKALIRKAFTIVVGSASVLGVLGMADAYTPDLWVWWDSFTGWLQVGCAVLVPVLLIAVGGALRRGERPEA